MAGDLNQPGLTTAYADWPTKLKNLFTDLLKMDGSTTNLPVGAIKWSAANNRFEIWSGTAWGALTAQMAQDVTSVLGAAPDVNAIAGKIAKRDGNGKLAGDITGNAPTATLAANATHATTADSATNATHATTADSATNAANADKIDGIHLIKASASWNIGVMQSMTGTWTTMTIPGAAVGDTVMAQLEPFGLASNPIPTPVFTAFVAAPNTIYLWAYNPYSVALNMSANHVLRVLVAK